jgi:hypothetical protein
LENGTGQGKGEMEKREEVEGIEEVSRDGEKVERERERERQRESEGGVRQTESEVGEPRGRRRGEELTAASPANRRA